jgi:hypothetical protein
MRRTTPWPLAVILALLCAAAPSGAQQETKISGVLHLDRWFPFNLVADRDFVVNEGSKSEGSTRDVELRLPIGLEEKARALAGKHVVVAGKLDCEGNWQAVHCAMIVREIERSDAVLPGVAKVPTDLAGIAGLDAVELSATARALLVENGFAVELSDAADFAEIYSDARRRGQGAFVTTDAVLHTGHIFFDTVLRVLEIDKLSGLLEALTDRMLVLSKAQYKEARNRELREAARLNIGFFAVAKAQFTPGFRPGYRLNGLVAKELANIEAHRGFAFRELLPYVPHPSLDRTPYAFEDYGQYVPRGHYTRNEAFQRFFKAMMWYGRVDFKLLVSEDGVFEETGRKMTLQALLMAEALARDDEAMRLWRRVYEPTVYFAGKTDDLSVDDYAALMREVFPGTGLARLADRNRQARFMKRARELRPPKILSGAAGSVDETRGFRFMGQRFIPDSYIFQELVHGSAPFLFTGSGKPFTMEVLPNIGPARAFPRGLDVMAVLGSRRALEILGRAGDTSYADYPAQFDKLSGLYAATTPDEWRQDLSWRWLHALLPLLGERPAGVPQPFLAGPAWRDKELQTALGSWTELRHDTVLYAKQSYTAVPKNALPDPYAAYGFVEPAPQVYSRLAAMFRDLRTTLDGLGLAVEGIPQKLEEFEAVLLRLEDISVREIAGEALGDDDQAFIGRFGDTLGSLARFPPELMRRVSSATDARMDIVVDVHTDPNTGQVLEEAIGAPADIYVIVRDGRVDRLCRGGIFTYYEFKHPLNDRLTDEKWQEMGRSKTRPARPDWLLGLGDR